MKPRLNDDDWTTADDPDYQRTLSAHAVDQHVAGMECKCLPHLVFCSVTGTIGIYHSMGTSSQARVRRAEGGHP